MKIMHRLMRQITFIPMPAFIYKQTKGALKKLKFLNAGYYNGTIWNPSWLPC
jgi:hypothetical protein